jgi:Cu-Zn family superoxide dismutase
MDKHPRHAWLAAAVALGLSACSSPSAQVGKPIVPQVATASAAATLVDPQGQPRGRVTLTRLAAGVEVVVNVEKLLPGAHGVHLHVNGRCTPGPDPSGRTIDFGGAGPHFDPGASNRHGPPGLAPEAGHIGDLPNIDVGADGTGTLRFVHPHATLDTGPNSALGRALIVHADPDDQRSNPAGNSGARQLCGVIDVARPTPPTPNRG